ncbi:rho GTPase-activating protein 5 [Dendrobium catenatum]|uniref:Rho-GAP domain-containing protein n=1 Tax=Dendrobium catenatum TaxID=906689 RepID=A0A2I0XGF1_9ASPA|nr:rho GTPase-activating protein 5 [Dendrobium catenatum]PKU86993.1 hypothetical protein MA16_Dca013940 [Dendrobium catenatum]
MVRFQLHLGYLFSFPLSHRASVVVAESEDTGSESGSECGADLIASPPTIPATDKGSIDRRGQQFSISEMATAALQRSLAMCSLGAGEEGAGACMDIGWPSDVRHVSHVTFDRFEGFLGLPVEFQPDVPSKVPSASIRVFGVSAESMQCSYDSRGNSVPTILLSMQRHLYSQGGLKVEGIFRINADNGQEMLAREELNKGVVPHGIDLHCLAALIKAWFRELPNGILDSIPPELVMHCNAKGECSHLIRMLPPTEAALLHWLINLMADVVEHEHYNKMNARNIAMVFAPNMTQMTDPLIALIHAVQVMNFLNTLIIETLHERELEAAEALQLHSNCKSHSNNDDDLNFSDFAEDAYNSLNEADDTDSDSKDSFRSFEKRSEVDDSEFISGRSSPTMSDSGGSKNGYGNFDSEGLLNRLSIRKGVQKLCRHSLFLLNRSTEKTGEIDIEVSGECP